ncbi:hypothetical protein DFP72DRAFT_433149 [Ephemerocybe angulata]|uniref:Nephrocystin 3-like N-terminal domain-containing protein n=1 Tax=Ephemerocybe angulata TaxID=980116 RepID=A0A8H6HUA5_9AGAR|nr:hypothetical protein DFP72DRAFT_433149 [Tulosesus angulatus]
MWHWFLRLWRRWPKKKVSQEEPIIVKAPSSPIPPSRSSGSAPYPHPSKRPSRPQRPGLLQTLGVPVESASQAPQDCASSSSNHPQPSPTPPPPAFMQPSPQSPLELNEGQFFPNANNWQVGEMNCTQYVGQPKQGSAGWERLVKETSVNALHNSSARFDPPKCDEDTRVELIREITTWIGDRNSPTQLLCMTGAAGSGKSAIQQTIAEKCVKKDILAASFFFNTGDTTRNNVSRVIPTIAYQLGKRSGALRQMIGIAVEDDTLIFKQTLQTQIEQLILIPVARLPPAEADRLPYAILIDGLDECNEEDDQRALLHAIHDSFLQRQSPFRIFLTSRPEQAIFGALAPGGLLGSKWKVYLIRLSDDHDATSDIRLTVRRNLERIGRQRGCEPTWFTEEDVDSIVAAASGQYIYAATAIRYITQPRRPPVESLRAIRSIQSGTPHDGDNPLAPLDSLYSLILTAAREAYEGIDTSMKRNFLLILRVYLAINTINLNLDIDRQDLLLGLGEGAFESLSCDIRSLLTTHSPGSHGAETTRIKVYHRSFLDFLNAPERAGALHIPKIQCAEYITESCLRRIDDDYTLEEIRDGSTLSDNQFKLRYKAKNLDLLDCAILLCAVLWRKDSPFAGDAPKDGVVSTLLQFGASGFEKIHAWVTHPVMHFVGAPQWIENTYPQFEFVERWEKCMEPELAKEFEKREPDLAKILKKYSREWAARKADMVAGHKSLRVVDISGRSSGKGRRDRP